MASTRSALRCRRFLALAALAVAIGGCGTDTPPAPSPLEEPRNDTSAEDAARPAVVEAYLREFGERLPRPAIHTDSIACGQFPHYMTVAYVRNGTTGRRMLAMYLAADGRTLVLGSEGQMKVDRTVAVPPAGRFSVLTVVIAHGATVGPDTMASLAAAQQTINAAHATFAATRGYAEPIVRFDFTNITVPPGAIPSPRSPGVVRAALEARGDNPSAFDFLAVINVDPAMSEGGFAQRGLLRPHFIYMGNFSAWQGRITAANVDSIARASYHHEVGHHWGWDHDWSPTCAGVESFAPFITSPRLYGWEDLDGDGIPEILDPSPYGR